MLKQPDKQELAKFDDEKRPSLNAKPLTLMLDLKLRPEFQTQRLKGTMIELTNASHTGAIEQSAGSFLEITYPSVDLIKCLEGVAPGQDRIAVLMGGRGQGKSHILAAIFHALSDPAVAKAWLEQWGQHLGNPRFSGIAMREGFRVVAEPLHNHRYATLWELLFDRAGAKGHYLRGKFEQAGTPVPSRDLILELLQEQPLALLLDEYQTWFDGLPDEKKQPRRTWAFNFIQVLSEIAAEFPDKLLLMVSVRDGNTDAYQQIHRLNPKIIDFSDPLTRRDRHRLLLHRIFSNRRQISPETIRTCIGAHFDEFVRLRGIAPAEVETWRERFLASWPFSPLLLDLLDDQVLIASQAQETRDLIRLLVETFKCSGQRCPVLTAADFRIDSELSAAVSLLNAVASELHRRVQEKAQRNLENVLASNPAPEVPHAAEIISALWLRSFNTDRLVGATYSDLQLDVTRDKPIDDNLFAVEIQRIKDSSFNIHEQGPQRIVFRDEENPDARLLAQARNDKLFIDRRDLAFLRKFLHALLAGDEQSPYRILVLPIFWQTKPWEAMDPEEHPSLWDFRTPIVALPESPENEHAALGEWLKVNLPIRRNALRFLLPKKGSRSIYLDRELLVQARAALLAKEWQDASSEYRQLRQKYERQLTDVLKDRFDRFAVLDRWNFAEPAKCTFHLTGHGKQGKAIPAAIQATVCSTLFIPEDFDDFVQQFAERGESVRKLLDELAEPRSGGAECVIWLGELDIVERLETLAAKGQLAINLRGSQLLQQSPGETETSALLRIRGKIGSGSHLTQTTVHKPQPAGATGGGVLGVGGGTSPTGPGPFLPGILGGGSTPERVGIVAPVNPFQSGEATVQSGDNETIPSPAASVHKLSSKTSALNLTGELEKWSALGQTPLRNITLRLDDMNGEKLVSLLRKLPDGTYILELDKEES